VGQSLNEAIDTARRFSKSLPGSAAFVIKNDDGTYLGFSQYETWGTWGDWVPLLKYENGEVVAQSKEWIAEFGDLNDPNSSGIPSSIEEFSGK